MKKIENLLFNNIFSRLIITLCMLLMSASAWAADYVIMSNSMYIGMNSAGNALEAKTSFDETCIWTCYNGNTATDLSTESRSMRNKKNTSQYLVASVERGLFGGSYTWTLSVGNQAAVWRIDGTNLYAYQEGRSMLGSWNRSASINATGPNSITLTDNSTTGSLSHKVTQEVDVAQNSNASLSVNCYNNPLTFSQQNTTLQAQVSGNYSPACKKYYFNYNWHHVYNGVDYGSNQPTLYSGNGATTAWSISGPGVTYATINASTGKLSYITESSSDVTVSVTATVTHPDFPDFQITGSADVTLQGSGVALVGFYLISSNSDRSYYIGTANSYYNGNTSTPYIDTYQRNTTWALYSYQGKYFLQDVETGRYMVMAHTNQAADAVYLKEMTNPVTGGAALFTINDITGSVTNIIPNGSEASLNPFGGNNDGRTIGLYWSGDGGSQWFFEPITSINPPIISITDAGQVTLSHDFASATIYYTTDGSTPTASSTRYTGQFEITYGTTVKAIAVLSTLTSDMANQYYGSYDAPVEITSLDQIAIENGWYKLTADVDASGSTIINNFTGRFDGDYHIISGLTHPIFGTLSGAEVKNVLVDNVTISGATVGAIAGEATNASRIYNCGVLATGTDFSDVYDKTYSSSSTISGTDAVGGIVGRLRSDSRVANCFSYADITAGRYVGGIVGDCVGAWYAGSTAGLMVANCMFYGNLTGTNRSPIVYGNQISGNYSIYSYFRYKSITTTQNLTQNGALAAQEDIWLKRFKFFQAAVTNHRDMAAYYIFGDGSRIDEMAQWYIDETIAPWPILRKAGAQKSILNRTIPNTGNANEGNLITNGKILRNRNDGTVADADVTQRYNMNVGTSGMLHVNFSISGSGVASGGQTYSVDLPITDMDHAHFDYTWGKVVLPFANEFDGWTPDYDYICTGWEITSVTGGTQGTLTDYNFADRSTYAKDIYDATNNPIIFAQGGNWIVPYGVTSVNIKAHFARAYYLADATYDRAAGGGNTHGGNRPNTYHGKRVYTSAADAWNAMSNQTLPHSQALVLVGNYHYNANTSGTYTGKGCTIMSIDEDKDQQPDYGWYTSVANYRQNWMPMRWDFIPMIGAGMTQIYNSMPPGIAIPVGKGWLEMTETCLCRTFEFESNDGARTSSDDGHSINAWIINGGWFQQMVRCYNSGTANKLSYMKIGGNAFIQEFFPGNHSGTTLSYTLRPTIVTGGEIVKCFMTGLKYSSSDFILAENNGRNMRFYCAGGKIDKYISSYMEHPVQDATMKVDHAFINRFFGGGTTSKAPVNGNIDITMDHSYVNFFCGGPEFGDMATGKTVTISTTGSIFGDYYGAGFGGTELTRISNGDGKNDHYDAQRLNYNAGNGGFEVSYEMEALLNGGGTALYRYYDYRAALSMATAGATTTTANKCLFLTNFYGGGCQGKVAGTINSTLTNCNVVVSAFGGGYKAAATTIDVYPAGDYSWQAWDGTYKAFSEPVYPDPVPFTWASGTAGQYNEGNKVLYTNADMSQMGRVTGDISITVNGGTVGQDVYGGGNESPSNAKTNVTITGNAQISGDVYGGANRADVGDNTVVDINSGTMRNVFGANNLSGVKSKTITVNIDQNVDETTHITGSVYGGGNQAAYSAPDNDKDNPRIFVRFATVDQNVFGGGLGASAQVTGNPQVKIGTSAAEEAGNDHTVSSHQVTIRNSVYGGGDAAPVVGNTNVLIDGSAMSDSEGIRINGYVFGGGLGETAVIRKADSDDDLGNTHVKVIGNVNVNHNVYGGGNGGVVEGDTEVIIGE